MQVCSESCAQHVKWLEISKTYPAGHKYYEVGEAAKVCRNRGRRVWILWAKIQVAWVKMQAAGSNKKRRIGNDFHDDIVFNYKWIVERAKIRRLCAFVTSA